MNHFYYYFGVCAIALSSCSLRTTEEIKNQSGQLVTASVYIDDSDKPTISNPVAVDADLTQLIGYYSSSTKITTKITLDGGVLVNDPYIVTVPDGYYFSHKDWTNSLSIPAITATRIELDSPESIEHQIENVDNSSLSPVSTLINFSSACLNGIYYKADDGSFRRLFSPTELNAVTPITSNLTSLIDTKIMTDSAHFGQLQALFPSGIDFKSSISTADYYQYHFLMKGTGWYQSNKSFNEILSALKSDPAKTQLLDKLNTALIRYSHLYYLDQVFVIGKLTIDIANSEKLSGNISLQANNYVSGGAAYTFSADRNSGKEIDDIPVRVRYSPIDILNESQVAVVSGHIGMETAIKEDLLQKLNTTNNIVVNIGDKNGVIYQSKIWTRTLNSP